MSVSSGLQLIKCEGKSKLTSLFKFKSPLADPGFVVLSSKVLNRINILPTTFILKLKPFLACTDFFVQILVDFSYVCVLDLLIGYTHAALACA